MEIFVDEDLILDALEACNCKKNDAGEFCYDWDYDGYDGSLGDTEALERGFNCPCCHH